MFACLHVTRRCNMGCPYCYAGIGGQKDMTLDVAIRIVDLLKSINVLAVLLLGGEPTLWKPLMKFNAYCEKVGMMTSITTNASMFGDADWFESYKKAPCTMVGVSLKAPDEIYFRNKISALVNFSQIKTGLCNIYKLSRDAVSNLLYGAGMNRDEVCFTAKFAYDLGARDLRLSFPTPVVNSDGNISAVDKTPIKELVNDVGYIYDRLYPLFGLRPNMLKIGHRLPRLCSWPKEFIRTLVTRGHFDNACLTCKRESIAFDISGNVLPCPQMTSCVIAKIDNDFNDGPSLLRHLNSGYVKDVYRRLARYPYKRCETCEWNSYCNGGCPICWTKSGQSVNCDGSPLENFLCSLDKCGSTNIQEPQPFGLIAFR